MSILFFLTFSHLIRSLACLYIELIFFSLVEVKLLTFVRFYVTMYVYFALRFYLLKELLVRQPQLSETTVQQPADVTFRGITQYWMPYK